MDAPLTPPSMPAGPNPNIVPAMGPGEVSMPQAPETAPRPEQAPAAEVAPAGMPAGAPVAAVPASGAAPVAMPAGALPAAPVVSTAPAVQPPAVPLPAVAGDVDVIEPEWVDKAEDVVQAHLGDPYSEEEAVEVLQEDYLQKRYGLTVKEPDSDQAKPGPV